MSRVFLIILGLLPIALFAGCAAEHRRIDGVNPREELFLLYPRMEKMIQLEGTSTDFSCDFGLDFDGPAGSLSLSVESGGTTYKGTRLAGSNMRLVVCGVPSDGGRITIVLKNHHTSSRMAALRIAAHKSDMCTPLSPVIDEYWARKTTAPHTGRPLADGPAEALR